MYESPISITKITDNIIKEQNEQLENDLMYQIRKNYHIDVDKEQLIRALQYDREQYEKGYKDGKADAQKTGHWITDGVDYRCSACGFEIDDEYYLGEGIACPNCGTFMPDGLKNFLG